MQKNKLFSFKYLIYDIAKWFFGWPVVFYYRLKKHYLTKEAKKHVKGSVLILSNHYGMEDPFIVHLTYWYRRARFCITDEFYKTKFGTFIFNSFLCFPINRDNPGFGALNKMGNELKKGSAVVIFPEGHINTNDSGVEAFKSGAILLAYRYNAPIQLMYFNKRKHWYNRVHVALSETIDVKALCGNKPTPDKIKEVSEILHNKEIELQELVNKNIK